MTSFYLREQIGNHVLRSATFAKPSQLWIAIFVVMPDNDGTSGTEVSGSGYSRVQHGPGDLFWSSNGSGVFVNTNSIQFSSPTSDWGTNLPGFGIYTQQASGIYLGKGLFNSPITVNNGGAAPAFIAGELSWIFGA